jgi:uncharacterized membrane protein
MEWWFGDSLGVNGHLIWGADSSSIAVSVVIGVVAIAFAFRKVASELRWLELGLWAVAVVIAVVSLAEPIWLEESGRTVPGRSVVLVDGSRSMGVLEGARPRSEDVQDILQQFDDSVDVYTFGSSVKAGAPEKWVLPETDLGAAFDAITDRYLGQSLQSIVVITDGLDRGGLRPSILAGSTSALPALPGPLTVYQVGESTALQDQAIIDVKTGGFAFLRTPFLLEAQLQGTPGRELPVTLRREGRLVDEANLTLDEEGFGEVQFEVTPNDVGRFIWDVSIPVDASDGVPGNNNYPVVVRVVRDRTRVLQVSGSPSYDQKFLRLFLKEDPSIDLVSFFILRTHEDFTAGWYSDELSLIAFPYERLFSEQLSTFDVVILQNFDYKPYFERAPEQLLNNIAQFVREGGSLVMIGGDRSFDLGAYGGTAIEEILPVRLGVEGSQVDVRPFLPALTSSGAGHPVTRLAGTAADSTTTWSLLPEMDGMNLNLGVVEGGAVLLEHPELRASGAPMPVLAIRELEHGRTMALMADASWRWSFSEAGTGKGNQAYLRFWKGAMRWLVADPDDRRLVVRPSKENLLVGEEMRLTIYARDAGYEPVSDSRVHGEIRGPDGIKSAFDVVTDASGQATTQFVPETIGAHRVLVSTSEHSSDQAETVFSVTNRDPELAEIVPDGVFLKKLTAAYGSKRAVYRGPGNTDAPMQDESAVRVVDERKQTSLAAVPLTALFFGVFASAAWWVRRRNGGL